jgi:cytochrome c-type biogenesis protein CcmH
MKNLLPSSRRKSGSITVEKRVDTGMDSGIRRSDGIWVFLLLLMLVLPAHAVQPDEILKDPALEARAREISVGLRCLVCQNQSIDDSDASVARDLRILIREQLQQNKSNQDVVDYVVARYGDYVLLKPRLTSHTLVLWFAPFAILLGCAVMLFWRKSRSPKGEDALTDTEKAQLDALLRK